MFSDVFVLFGKVVRGRRVQCSVTWDWRRRPHPPPASAFTHTTLPSLPGAAQTPVCSMFNLLLLLFLHTTRPFWIPRRMTSCLLALGGNVYSTIFDSFELFWILFYLIKIKNQDFFWFLHHVINLWEIKSLKDYSFVQKMKMCWKLRCLSKWYQKKYWIVNCGRAVAGRPALRRRSLCNVGSLYGCMAQPVLMSMSFLSHVVGKNKNPVGPKVWFCFHVFLWCLCCVPVFACA